MIVYIVVPGMNFSAVLIGEISNIILSSGMKQKGKKTSLFLPLLSVNISHGTFYLISNRKSTILLF